MVTVCPIGTAAMAIPAAGPCPALEWTDDSPRQSRCGLIAHPEKHLTPARAALLQHAIPDLPQAMGSGAGCCMSARILHRGTTIDFASLPAEEKHAIAQAFQAP